VVVLLLTAAQALEADRQALNTKMIVQHSHRALRKVLRRMTVKTADKRMSLMLQAQQLRQSSWAVVEAQCLYSNLHNTI
jgi:hypothetical protein